MKDYECSVCKKELNGSEAYEYRGVISCIDCHDEAIKRRDSERAEIIAESKHKTDKFRGLDLGDNVIGKANREILKPDIEIAKKESGRRLNYEKRITPSPNRGRG